MLSYVYSVQFESSTYQNSPLDYLDGITSMQSHYNTCLYFMCNKTTIKYYYHSNYHI